MYKKLLRSNIFLILLCFIVSISNVEASFTEAVEEMDSLMRKYKQPQYRHRENHSLNCCLMFIPFVDDASVKCEKCGLYEKYNHNRYYNGGPGLEGWCPAFSNSPISREDEERHRVLKKRILPLVFNDEKPLDICEAGVRGRNFPTGRTWFPMYDRIRYLASIKDSEAFESRNRNLPHPTVHESCIDENHRPHNLGNEIRQPLLQPLDPKQLPFPKAPSGYYYDYGSSEGKS
jgi:hypothetical protein